MGRKIDVTLDDTLNAPATEQANVMGWVQEGWKHYKEPGWIPTKLVLELRTKERWADVAAEFPELMPPGEIPPVEPPASSQMYDLPWATMSDYLRTQGVMGNTVMAFRFTVPAGYHSPDASRISGAEFGGGPVLRDSVISETPFDFDHPLPNGKDFGNPVVQFWMQVGGASGSRVVLQAGRTYYCNVRSPTAPASDACNMSFQMMVPPTA